MCGRYIAPAVDKNESAGDNQNNIDRNKYLRSHAFFILAVDAVGISRRSGARLTPLSPGKSRC
jgi:hypothetical protein